MNQFYGDFYKFEQDLKALSSILNLTPPKDIQSLAKYLSNKMTFDRFKQACKFLEETFTSQHFPKPGDFLSAGKTYHKEDQNQDWRQEFAKKSGIPVDRFPNHACFLNEEQRNKLGMFTKREEKVAWEIVKEKLGFDPRKTKPENKRVVETE